VIKRPKKRPKKQREDNRDVAELAVTLLREGTTYKRYQRRVWLFMEAWDGAQRPSRYARLGRALDVLIRNQDPFIDKLKALRPDWFTPRQRQWAPEQPPLPAHEPIYETFEQAVIDCLSLPSCPPDQ
jgi:hypothetical protein